MAFYKCKIQMTKTFFSNLKQILIKDFRVNSLNINYIFKGGIF